MYEKDYTPVFIGVLYLLASLIAYIVNNNYYSSYGQYDLSEENKSILIYIGLFSLAVRIGVVFWVYNIAKKLNRNAIGWTILGFFIPSITLVILGLQKKLNFNFIIKDDFPIKQKVSLMDKAINLNKIGECIEKLNKIIEIDNKNFEAIKLRGELLYDAGNYVKSKIDFEILYQNKIYMSEVFYYYGNFSIIRNIEEAIEYWLKAKELGNQNAQIQIDLHNNYNGVYLLNCTEAYRKVGRTKIALANFFIGKSEYIKGLAIIDKNNEINKKYTRIGAYKNGLIIELEDKIKTFYIAIAYYEIIDIILDKSNSKFEFHTLGNIVFEFHNERLLENSWSNNFYNNFLKLQIECKEL